MRTEYVYDASLKFVTECSGEVSALDHKLDQVKTLWYYVAIVVKDRKSSPETRRDSIRTASSFRWRRRPLRVFEFLSVVAENIQDNV